MESLKTVSLFSGHSPAYAFLCGFEYPWEALPKIGAFLLSLGATLPREEYDSPAENVWIAKSARVAPSASITGPCIVCAGAEIRHGAYIRGNVLVGADAVVGNSVELKNVILFDKVQVPHFNYVGDSILGYASHLGAGAITSNIKSDKTNVTVRFGEKKIETGLRKMGAILGERVEVGCNSVLNPGTVIGCDTTVYPLSSVRGFIPAGHIFKNCDHIVKKENSD